MQNCKSYFSCFHWITGWNDTSFKIFHGDGILAFDGEKKIYVTLLELQGYIDATSIDEEFLDSFLACFNIEYKMRILHFSLILKSWKGISKDWPMPNDLVSVWQHHELVNWKYSARSYQRKGENYWLVVWSFGGYYRILSMEFILLWTGKREFRNDSIPKSGSYFLQQ